MMSREHFESIIECMGGPFFVKDRQHKFVLVNDAVCELLGIPRKEWLGKTAHELFPGEQADVVRRHDDYVFETGRIHENKHTITDAYGNRRTVITKKTLYASTAGERYIIGTVQDVTEQKRTEEALRDTEKRYYRFFETLRDGFASVAMDGRITESNPAFQTMVGYTREELSGIMYHAITPGKWHAVEETIIREQVLKRGYSDVYEKEYIRKGGAVFPVELRVHLLRGESGDPEEMWAFIRDITGRKQMEAALRESEEKYRSIFENAAEGMFQTTPEGLLLSANPAYARMFGYSSAEEITGGSFNVGERVYVDDADRARFKKEIDEKGLIQAFQFQAFKKDGARVWACLNARAVKDRTGRTLYYEGTIEDITSLKQAEKEARDNAERYRRLFDLESDAIFLIDNETGRILEANNAAVSLYGFSREEILEKRSEDLSAEPEKAQRATQNKLNVIPIRYHRKKDGTVFPVEITETRLMWNGRTSHLAAIRDITERKRIEDVLRRNEEEYRNIHDNAMVGIFKSTPEGRYLRVNNALSSIHGFSSPEEMIATVTNIGRQLYVNPKDRERYMDLLRKDDAIRGFEAQLYRKDGSTVWISMNVKAARDPAGSVTWYEGIVEDMTGRKRAEEDLKQTHQRLLDIIEFLPDGTFVIDEEKKVMAWNRACEEMTGVSKEDIVGRGDYAYSIPFYGEKRPILIDLVTVDSNELQKNYTSVERKGHLLYAEADTPMLYGGKGAVLSGMAAPLFDRTGRVTGAIESIRDITEHRKLESQLRQAQKMESLGTLAGGIAHDFNNILTSLMGYATLVQMKMDEADPLRQYVGQVLSASEKAADLVRGLLAFSRQQSVRLAPLSINDTIKGTEKLLKRLLTEDIGLHTSLATGETIVLADRSQIDQILFNLATNARDAMPKGGTLSIATDVLTLDAGFVRTHGFGQEGRYVLITVSDTGMGMDEATKENIFDPFFTTKETGKGTGLGLSTVYGIVRQHNGHITVYSERDVGTTFHIYLPVANEAGKKETPVQAPVEKGSETILIAEDSKSVRGLFRRILSEYGYTIVEAHDGADAVDKFKKTDRTHLLILDSVMPVKNGRETYDEIRRIKPDIKAIFVSGHTRDVFLNKGIEEGTFNFLQKPVSPDTLLRKVREVLDNGQSSR